MANEVEPRDRNILEPTTRLPEHFATPSITPKTFQVARKVSKPGHTRYAIRVKLHDLREERRYASNVGKHFRELPPLHGRFT